MILFKEDWTRYHNAIPDDSTTNESFKHICDVYGDMGVENRWFPLALMNPMLQGVDPYDPNITADTASMIEIEAKFNYWYYLREVSYLAPSSGTKGVRYRAHRGSIAQPWCFLAGCDVFHIQPRQTGKSVGTDAMNIWLLDIRVENTTINILTRGTDLRVAHVLRLKGVREQLPPYIHQEDRNEAANQQGLSSVRLNNRIKFYVARAAFKDAEKAARGFTAPIQEIDEFAYCSWISCSVGSMVSSGNASRKEAQGYGYPTGQIYTTTPGERETRDGKFAYEFFTSGIPFTEKLYDLRNSKTLVAYCYKNAPGKTNLISLELNHRQVGITDEEHYENINRTPKSKTEIEKDYFNLWPSGGKEYVLTQEERDAIETSIRMQDHLQISKQKYGINWYIPKDTIMETMANCPHVMSMDPSEMVGRDSFAGNITNLTTGETTATMSCNMGDIQDYGNFIAMFLVVFTRTTLLVEAKSTGSSIISIISNVLIEHGEDPVKRIYNSYIDKMTPEHKDYEYIKMGPLKRPAWFLDKIRKFYGFSTTGDKRDFLYDTVFKRVIRALKSDIRDRRLGRELRGLVKKNGRVDHETKGHDDNVIALLLSHWFMTECQHPRYYGIEPSEIRLIQASPTSELTENESYDEQLRKRNIAEFEALVKQLENEADPLRSYKIQRRLRLLQDWMSTDETYATVSIAAMAEEARKRLTGRTKEEARKYGENPDRETVGSEISRILSGR